MPRFLEYDLQFDEVKHITDLNENHIYAKNKAVLREENREEGEIARMGEHLQAVYFKMRLKAQGELIHEMRKDMDIMKKALIVLTKETGNQQLISMMDKLSVKSE